MAKKHTTVATTTDTNGTPAASLAGRKTYCPITRAQFTTVAKVLTVKVGDRDFLALPKEFSTGSLGWNVNDKITLDIGGTPVVVQVGMNLTLVGSKDLPH